MKNNREVQVMKYIFCAMAAGSLSRNVFAGFYMHAGLQNSAILTFSAAFVILVVFFAVHQTRFGYKLSLPVTLAVLTGVIVVIVRDVMTWGAAQIDSAPGLPAALLLLVSVAVFWSAGSLLGILLLFLAGSLTTVFFAFLQYPVSDGNCMIFVFSMTALLLFRPGCHFSSSQRYDRRTRLQFIAQPLLFALLVFIFSGAVYFGLVKPYAPQPDNTQLAQRLMSMELMADLGISSKKVVITENPKELQNQEKPKDDRRDTSTQDNKAKTGQTARQGAGDNVLELMAVTYEKNTSRIWITLMMFTLIVLLTIAAKLQLRRRWYHAVLKLSDEAGAEELYRFFVKKLKKAGFVIPEDLTLLEYAEMEHEFLARFAVYDSSFLRLTEIYQRMIYGYRRISYSEYELFHDFYLGFYKNLRAAMGVRRYYCRFFSL